MFLCDGVYLSCAIFAISDVKKTTEITSDGFRPRSNMLNISFAMGMFSLLKVHLLLMDFDDF